MSAIDQDIRRQIPASVISGAFVILLYCLFTVASWAFYPFEYGPLTHYLSRLGNYLYSPNGAYLYNIGCILTGIVLIPFFAGLSVLKIERKLQNILLRLGQFFGILSAIALILIGIFSEDKGAPHMNASTLFFLLNFIVLLLISSAIMFHGRLGKVVGLLGIIIDITALGFEILLGGPIVEWYTVFASLVFVAMLSILVLRSNGSLQLGSNILGLSGNLWRLAAVMGISQISVALWKWQFGIFLEGYLQPWQIGFVFSIATLTGLIGSFASGYIADFIGRRLTISLGILPVTVGLITMSYVPIWPFVAVQYGLVWFGMSAVRLMARAMPADEIAIDRGMNPARRMMMVMMPLWFFDALGPLTGSLALSGGYQPSNLHFTGALLSIVTFFVALLLIKESLGTEVIQKARAGPKIALGSLGSEFWLLALGMIGFFFCWSASVPYLGNLSVGPWSVDVVTYGVTWSLFSFVTAAIMYPASTFADRNLKRALLAGVVGNALIFIWFAFGQGVLQMYLVNFFWAIPFVLWIGAERSIIVLVVSEETKGRALGTYDLLMGITSMGAQFFGAMIWEITDSLRLVWTLSGLGMIICFVFLIPILRRITSLESEPAIPIEGLPIE